MKKTLAAVAVLGAFAGSALAADVQLYGRVDEGFAYSHVDLDQAGQDATDSFSLNSGMQSGSRFGIKGTEDLGNGLTVGFILENGFTADNGADNSTFFDRESSLFLQGSFGKLAVGKIGSINCGTSSWALVGMASAFGTSNWGGYSAQIGSTAATSGVLDNMIAYQTPDFAGFKVYAQYSMGDDADKAGYKGVENESSTDRYYALGATYGNGPLNLYLAVDSINYASWDGANATDTDDSLTVTFGANYDFEVAKVYFGAQYFDEVKTFGGLVTALKTNTGDAAFAGKIKGYGLNLSADFPVMGGKVMAGLGYVDAEAADSVKDLAGKDEFQRYVVSVGYDYPFSKRTDVYTVASYMQDSVDYGDSAKGDVDPNAFTFVVGLRHLF